jgi:RluA family pseudouridine synthase
MATPRGGEHIAVENLIAAAGLAPDLTRDLFLVHRLDVGTSGVVLLAKGSEAHRAASRLFQERSVEKTYRAVVWGHPKPSADVVDSALAMDREDRRKMKVSDAGKPARTRYRTLARLPSIAHLELTPETGRTHQLRVHLGSRGHPIVGDDLYGGPRWRGVRDPRLRAALREVPRLLLHALRLELRDPLSGEEIRIESPEPAEFSGLLDVSG